MTQDASQQYFSPPTVVSRVVGTETVLVDLDGERYFSLNQIGSLIWAELSAGRPAEEALARVLAEFEVDSEVAGQDLSELVAALVDTGLLLPHS